MNSRQQSDLLVLAGHTTLLATGRSDPSRYWLINNDSTRRTPTIAVRYSRPGHTLHCRVLPPGKFSDMICPRATLLVYSETVMTLVLTVVVYVDNITVLAYVDNNRGPVC